MVLLVDSVELDRNMGTLLVKTGKTPYFVKLELLVCMQSWYM